MAHTMTVVCRPEIAAGFALAGLRPVEVETPEECAAQLRRICDPEAVNAEAFADQRRRIAEHGGANAIQKRGDYSYTPAPGEKPVLVIST